MEPAPPLPSRRARCVPPPPRPPAPPSQPPPPLPPRGLRQDVPPVPPKASPATLTVESTVSVSPGLSWTSVFSTDTCFRADSKSPSPTRLALSVLGSELSHRYAHSLGSTCKQGTSSITRLSTSLGSMVDLIARRVSGESDDSKGKVADEDLGGLREGVSTPGLETHSSSDDNGTSSIVQAPPADPCTAYERPSRWSGLASRLQDASREGGASGVGCEGRGRRSTGWKKFEASLQASKALRQLQEKATEEVMPRFPKLTMPEPKERLPVPATPTPELTLSAEACDRRTSLAQWRRDIKHRIEVTRRTHEVEALRVNKSYVVDWLVEQGRARANQDHHYVNLASTMASAEEFEAELPPPPSPHPFRRHRVGPNAYVRSRILDMDDLTTSGSSSPDTARLPTDTLQPGDHPEQAVDDDPHGTRRSRSASSLRVLQSLGALLCGIRRRQSRSESLSSRSQLETRSLPTSPAPEQTRRRAARAAFVSRHNAFASMTSGALEQSIESQAQAPKQRGRTRRFDIGQLMCFKVRRSTGQTGKHLQRCNAVRQHHD